MRKKLRIKRDRSKNDNKRRALSDVIAEQILALTDRFRSLESRQREQQQFKEIYIGSDALQKGKLERIKRASLCLKLLLSVILLALIAGYKEQRDALVLENNTLYRPQKVQEAELNWKSQNLNGEEKESTEGQIQLKITPQRLFGEERETMFAEAKDYILGCIRGENQRLTELRGDLFFPETVPDTELLVYYQLSSYEWLNPDGSRTENVLPKEGAEENLTITMVYYEEERNFPLKLYLFPPEQVGERVNEELRQALDGLFKDNRGNIILLPEILEEQELHWSIKDKRSGVLILLLGITAIICVWLSGKQKREKQLKKREEELMADYPELVSKYLLLLKAGLSTRAVWNRIIADYRKSDRTRYVYEEMIRTGHELENGVSEAKAYEQFGKRCRLLPYLRFSGTLVQVLTKGSSGSLTLLEQEARNAFAERKAAAKRLGEEAGTKLLLPMIGLLGIVLVIVLFPAFQSL